MLRNLWLFLFLFCYAFVCCSISPESIFKELVVLTDHGSIAQLEEADIEKVWNKYRLRIESVKDGESCLLKYHRDNLKREAGKVGCTFTGFKSFGRNLGVLVHRYRILCNAVDDKQIKNDDLDDKLDLAIWKIHDKVLSDLQAQKWMFFYEIKGHSAIKERVAFLRLQLGKLGLKQI